MWYAKMYFLEKREFFQYDAAGTQGVPSVSRELLFLESLLSFLEMDCEELAPMLRQITENCSRLISEDDRQAGANAMVELGQLKQRHIYLELLYVRWYDRFSRMGAFGDRSSEEDRQMLEELRLLPEQLPYIRNRSSGSWSWSWTWTARGGTLSSRRPGTIYTTHRRIRRCLPFILSLSVLSRWSRGAARRCYTPPASRT